MVANSFKSSASISLKCSLTAAHTPPNHTLCRCCQQSASNTIIWLVDKPFSLAISSMESFNILRSCLTVAQVSVAVNDFSPCLEMHSLDVSGIKSWRSGRSGYNFSNASFHRVINERAWTNSWSIVCAISPIRCSLTAWFFSPCHLWLHEQQSSA